MSTKLEGVSHDKGFGYSPWLASTLQKNYLGVSARSWLMAYAAMTIITLIFQIWVRSSQCDGLAACGLSFSKAVVWAVIWPASWAVYLPGVM